MTKIRLFNQSEQFNMRPAATLIRGSYFAEIAGIFSFCALLILGCMREQLKREKAKIVSHLDLAIIHDIK